MQQGRSLMTRQAGRPPRKREAVLEHLRQRIVGGELSPGAALPSHHEIERRFQATPATVQEAMRILRAEGFVETRPRRGTFVVRHPPHLCNYALAFPWDPRRRGSQFYRAICLEAARVKGIARRISVFHNIESHVDVEDYARLASLVRAQRLAGIVFAARPFGLLEGTPLLDEPGMPRVVIESRNLMDTAPTVYPDLPAFLPAALARLAADGRRRVAVITATAEESPEPPVEAFCELAAERGLLTRPHWLQAVSVLVPAWGRQVARLLFAGERGERPDALVVTDDNLVPAVTAGVTASGVRVPRDVEVVAHTNFPHPTPSAVPAIRLGYDIRSLVALCLERIDQQRRGERPPRRTLLPPLFERELSDRPQCSAPQPQPTEGVRR